MNILEEFELYKAKDLHIDLSRGRPSKEQLDLSLPMMDILTSSSDYLSSGVDTRNYGCLEGLKECRDLFSPILGVPSNNIIIMGNSSINIMYDQISRSMLFGVCGSTPWSKLNKIKWLCPVPGYDRHFAILEHFGIEMIPIHMDENGPDVDEIEKYISDESVKGLWCVPKYSNPSGITYSDEVVRRLSRLSPKAKDFRIYWDYAYAIHDFDEESKLLNIYEEAKRNGNEDIIYLFTSTSKVTFPGSGISMIGASERNINDIKSHLTIQTIGYDKINQLRHVRFFKTTDGLKNHMKKHGEILKRKFDIVESILSRNLNGLAKWSHPKGGYFVLLEVKGIASQVVERCKECGVVLTAAGATHPYHKDLSNSYIRIAPSSLSDEDLKTAMQVLCVAVKIEHK